MQYTHLATITTKSGQMRDFLRKIETDLLPRVHEEPGFVACTAARAGESSAVCCGIWQTRDQAERSMKSLDKWIREDDGQMVASVQSHVGELPFLALASDPKSYVSQAPVAGART
jgi:hypothetical protein